MLEADRARRQIRDEIHVSHHPMMCDVERCGVEILAGHWCAERIDGIYSDPVVAETQVIALASDNAPASEKRLVVLNIDLVEACREDKGERAAKRVAAGDVCGTVSELDPRIAPTIFGKLSDNATAYLAGEIQEASVDRGVDLLVLSALAIEPGPNALTFSEQPHRISIMSGGFSLTWFVGRELLDRNDPVSNGFVIR